MSETPEINRRNVIIMLIIALVFIIGIIVRRDYIKHEMKDTYNFYKERMDVK